MSFDPFGDSKTAGYLRNIHCLPEGPLLKEMEHQDFVLFAPEILSWLGGLAAPVYRDLLTVHRELFCGLYPWAGKDRFELFPNSIVSKGSTDFALSNNIKKAFDLGDDPKLTPGQTLGHWAYAHHFLEGDGRALFTFFDDRPQKEPCDDPHFWI